MLASIVQIHNMTCSVSAAKAADTKLDTRYNFVQTIEMVYKLKLIPMTHILLTAENNKTHNGFY